MGGGWASIGYCSGANLDLFRLSVELTGLVALWTKWLCWLRSRIFRSLIIIIYLLSLAYYGYEAIVRSIYHTDPVFFSQYYLGRGWSALSR